MIRGKEVSSVAITQEVKKKKKIEMPKTLPKPKVKKEKKIATPKQAVETTESPKPILKSKEWKLLYRPYPFRTTSNSSSPMTNAKNSNQVKGIDSGQYKGLCRNCKRLKTCTLPKPQGGVWRCEEYE
jgi:hypothetical protein